MWHKKSEQHEKALLNKRLIDRFIGEYYVARDPCGTISPRNFIRERCGCELIVLERVERNALGKGTCGKNGGKKN